MSKMSKIPVAVLGATGMVGQRFISLLEDHPTMELVSLVASEKREGKRYKETVNWLLDIPMPEQAGKLRLFTLGTRFADLGAKLVFSALPAEEAERTEDKYASEGAAVFSNVKVNRMRPDVPILVPEINPEHLGLIDVQRRARKVKKGSGGFIVTNANCTTTGLVMALCPLKMFNIRKVFVSTYQALTGAGYPGVASLDIVGNLIPFIGEEEDKMIEETAKILGTFENDAITPYPLQVFPTCIRVPVRDGHTETVWVDLEKNDLVEVADAMMKFKGLPQRLHLPSAPDTPLVVHTKKDRPQPIKDARLGAPPTRAKGMAVSVGRLRAHENMVGFTLLVHNTIRGAAGGSILNAELAISEGIVK
jgi:aspartate-semialdehyde dehydrogenase